MITKNFVTPEILKSLDQINQDCIKMHLPTPPALFVRCEVSDIDSGEIEFVQFQKANSFLRNYHNLMFSVGSGCAANSGGDTYGAGKISITIIGGTVRSANMQLPYDSWAYLDYEGGKPGKGICVGTGTTAWSFEQYALATRIEHGTGAGQMSYGAEGSPTFAYTSGTKKYSLVQSRIISNSSGGSISVAEIGWGFVLAGNYYTLLERTLLESPIAVASGKKITVTYTFEMTFPA